MADDAGMAAGWASIRAKENPPLGRVFFGASVSLLQMRKQEQKRSRPAPG
jgi:hypothetical protein